MLLSKTNIDVGMSPKGVELVIVASQPLSRADDCAREKVTARERPGGLTRNGRRGLFSLQLFLEASERDVVTVNSDNGRRRLNRAHEFSPMKKLSSDLLSSLWKLSCTRSNCAHCFQCKQRRPGATEMKMAKANTSPRMRRGECVESIAGGSGRRVRRQKMI